MDKFDYVVSGSAVGAAGAGNGSALALGGQGLSVLKLDPFDAKASRDSDSLINNVSSNVPASTHANQKSSKQLPHHHPHRLPSPSKK